MDAKGLHDALSSTPMKWADIAAFVTVTANMPIILRALSLLAAAEANDGTAPETDAAEIKVQLGSDYALTGNVPYADCARLERQRNGLAAEVRRLKVLLRSNVPWVRIDA